MREWQLNTQLSLKVERFYALIKKKNLSQM